MKKDEIQCLSGLVDEHEDDTKTLLRLSQDCELNRCWRRYHLMGEAIRNNLAMFTDRRFPEKVMRAVDLEPMPEIAFMRPANQLITWPWTKRVGGIALAASIALLVIMLVPSRQIPVSVPQIAQTSPNIIIKANNIVSGARIDPSIVSRTTAGIGLADSIRNGSQDELSIERGVEMIGAPSLFGIDQYVLRHSAVASMDNTLPYARMVGYLSDK